MPKDEQNTVPALKKLGFEQKSWKQQTIRTWKHWRKLDQKPTLNAIGTLKQEKPIPNSKTAEHFLEGSIWHDSGKMVKYQIRRNKGNVCPRKRKYCVQGYRGESYKECTKSNKN